MIPLFVLGQTIFLVTENIAEPLPITKCDISKEYKSLHVLSITNDISSITGINRSLFSLEISSLFFVSSGEKELHAVNEKTYVVSAFREEVLYFEC